MKYRLSFAAIAAGMLFFAWTAVQHGRKPISAYGVAICGNINHVIIVYGDGKQRIVKGRDILTDEEVRYSVEKLPPEKTGAFNVCPKAPLQVY